MIYEILSIVTTLLLSIICLLLVLDVRRLWLANDKLFRMVKKLEKKVDSPTYGEEVTTGELK